MNFVFPEIGPLFDSAIKIGIIIFLIVYSVFSFMVNKQVKLMTKTLEVGLESLLKIISILHFFFSLALLVAAIIIL
jgi:hypothetical protein